jgi:hypothetical protein
MKTLLVVEVSPRLEFSVSRKLTARFVEQWKRANPHGVVVVRDLFKSHIPFVAPSTAAHHPDFGRGDRSRRGHVEVGVVEWAWNGAVIASTSVETFIRIIAAAPRLTAKPSPCVVAAAPNTRASAPIDR